MIELNFNSTDYLHWMYVWNVYIIKKKLKEKFHTFNEIKIAVGKFRNINENINKKNFLDLCISNSFQANFKTNFVIFYLLFKIQLITWQQIEKKKNVFLYHFDGIQQ